MKTWLTAVFCVCKAILYPRSHIIVCSYTKKQANQILQKIERDLMQLHGWGSELLKREIVKINISPERGTVEFDNHSDIVVVTSSENARGEHGTVLIIDEFRMVDLNTINSVLRKFLTVTRDVGYRNNPQYKDVRDENQELYLSSVWLEHLFLCEKIIIPL